MRLWQNGKKPCVSMCRNLLPDPMLDLGSFPCIICLQIISWLTEILSWGKLNRRVSSQFQSNINQRRKWRKPGLTCQGKHNLICEVLIYTWFWRLYLTFLWGILCIIHNCFSNNTWRISLSTMAVIIWSGGHRATYMRKLSLTVPLTLPTMPWLFLGRCK